MSTEMKDFSLEALEDKMKIELKNSEVDTADNPEKMALIGSGPKAAPSPSDPPGQPFALDPIIQGPCMLFLDWKAPALGNGDTVRTYIFERRESNKQGAIGDWNQVGVSLDSELLLNDQPRGDKLEYRIIAVNKAGNGQLGNTVMAVLWRRGHKNQVPIEYGVLAFMVCPDYPGEK